MFEVLLHKEILGGKMKLELVNINKYYDDFHVLQDVNLEINSGRLFAYLGRNGAGKTTSIRILMDVFKANSGEILIDGVPFDLKKYRVGYLPEDRGLYTKSTVKDQLLYFAKLRGLSHKEAVASVEYWTKRFGIDEYLNRLVETLSKGNQQKVQITQAFVNNPDILILDEPFSGLDPVNSQVFQEALEEFIGEKKIVIFSSHQMGFVESFCKDIAIIHHGKIVISGELSVIKQQYGIDKIRVKTDNDTKLEKILKENNFPYQEDAISLIIDYKGRNKKEILTLLIENQFEINIFSDYQPSLQEIFISKVGDENETV